MITGRLEGERRRSRTRAHTRRKADWSWSLSKARLRASASTSLLSCCRKMAVITPYNAQVDRLRARLKLKYASVSLIPKRYRFSILTAQVPCAGD
jgi:hypothetical protein